MVDGVHAPQQRYPVKEPMDSILKEVGEDDHLRDLKRQWLRRHHARERLVTRPPEERRGRQNCEKKEEVHEHVIHEEVDEVGGEALAKDGLWHARKKAFERHVDDGQQKQVEQEPIEPEMTRR